MATFKTKAGILLGMFCAIGAVAQPPDPEAYRQRSMQFSNAMNERGLAEPFRGITTDGNVQPGLFEIRSTGIPTAPVNAAASAFLATLNADQRERISFGIDDDEWRKWANQHIYYRDGISFEEMTPVQ